MIESRRINERAQIYSLDFLDMLFNFYWNGDSVTTGHFVGSFSTNTLYRIINCLIQETSVWISDPTFLFAPEQGVS
jgi:hypothetical protein